jgi:hypothetical protein
VNTNLTQTSIYVSIQARTLQKQALGMIHPDSGGRASG